MEFGKTFTCSFTGCEMTFTTQENLTVHKRKHLMLLNFDNGSKANSCIDQTPTPTRFIRNCEEVGLFQDLQNVNPFEETFRKANEAGGAARLVEIDLEALPDTDDTLHTPPFYPNITGQVNAQSSTQTMANNGSDDSISDIVEVPSNGYLNNKRSEYSNGATPVSERYKLNTHSRRRNRDRAVSSEDTNTSKGQLATNGAIYQRVRRIAPHPSAESASTGALQSTSTGFNQQQNALANTKLALRNTLLNTKRPTTPSNRSSPSKKVFTPPSVAQVEKQMTEEEKRLFRERNRCGNLSCSSLTDDSRVAALRCREKRKKRVQGLETKIKVLETANHLHEAQIAYLNKELQKYKEILLKHRDCSVTRAENEGGTGALAGTSVSSPSPSSQVAYQTTNPAAQAISYERKLLSMSKESRSAPVKVEPSQIQEQPNKTLTSSTAPSQSSQVMYQTTNPVAQVINYETKLLSMAKESRSAPVKVEPPQIPGQPNKTLTLSKVRHPPDSVQNAGITGDRMSQPSGDPLSSLAMARRVRTPPAMPPVARQTFLRTPHAANVNNPATLYIVNLPVQPSADVGEDVYMAPNTNVLILVNKYIKTEPDPPIEAPEVNILTEDVSLSSVEEVPLRPRTARDRDDDEDDEVMFLAEMPPAQ